MKPWLRQRNLAAGALRAALVVVGVAIGLVAGVARGAIAAARRAPPARGRWRSRSTLCRRTTPRR
ncbi:MAG: hypothetical protein KGL18_18080 [Burkholderiales bacterium]|nr:hypothetical protein [Burkholderiales bacterium]MDE2159636.1 hypothetical protein [Burkholderiales bacterium]MDE2504876.1 hypothetical protein [Burkholderiales bacterium]